jgi:hypothetical protein
MNNFSKIAEGLAGWLLFEQRCGRKALFRESLLAHPIHQLLSYHFPGRVQAEVPHLRLAPIAKGRGRKPCIDFVVTKPDERFAIAVETKWVSKSPTLLQDILRDVVRLDLLVPEYADEAMLIVAGLRKDFEALFAATQFQPHPAHLGSKHILPLKEHVKSSVRFVPVPKFRKSLYTKVLEPFQGLPISCSIPLERSGPFPRIANVGHYEVYLWRLRKYGQREQFIPENVYPTIGKAEENEATSA